MREISKSYDPGKVEKKWYELWETKRLFHARTDAPGPVFSIVIPPPNITGSLHMGHALNTTLQDILVRWRRMGGYNTLWLPGTDHAGIATQNVVERELSAKGYTRQEIGREAFVKKVWEWREHYGRRIIYQLKRLGASCDWERERFTMDEGMSRAVREVFVRLYEDGLIYRGHYMINWCPRCMTALSDLEVEHEEKRGKLYYVKYPLVDSSGHLIIATTRPETILGDTAVAVHPEDPRYKKYIGKKVRVPLTDREVPVIGDEIVDMEFGTGVLKITPSHDPNDFEVGKRHNLPGLKVIGDDGRMSKEAGPYAGMDRFECRKRIVADLESEGYLVKEEDYIHAVGHCYRCKTVIEPAVSEQWFIRMKPLAEPAIRVVEEGKIRFIPEGWVNTYYEWMNNIKDWCISRQIWWGHQIPAWFCGDCGGITVDRIDPERCKHCGSRNIRRDEDVLDTWFSSALWPFATLGWPEETEDLRRFYPTSVLVTGFDILFFWVARMIMMGLRFMGDVPFREVCIHALVRDEEGQKMSKSRGNVIDPLIMMDRYGTDALRFTLASMASPGRDIKLSEKRIEGNKNFTNKIWNATRFILMNVDKIDLSVDPSFCTLPDRWILSRLNRIIDDTQRLLEEYRFDLASMGLYKFFWHEFCDWYLELAKIQIGEGGKRKEHTGAVLIYVLDKIIRLLHPFMPYITEEIWSYIHEGSIVVAPFPETSKELIDSSSEEEMEILMEIIRAIRSIRAELNIGPSVEIPALIRAFNQDIIDLLKGGAAYIKRLSRVDEFTIGIDIKRPEKSAVAVFGQGEIYLPLSGIIDIEKEKSMLKRRLDTVEEDLKRIEKKLSNPSFIERAPSEVVEKERNKLEELKTKKERLEANLSWLT